MSFGTKFNLMRGVRTFAGVKCDIVDLMQINDIIKYYNGKIPDIFSHYNKDLSDEENEAHKVGSPCVQVYTTGKREDKTGNFDIWNGFVVIDIDSKKYNGKLKDELLEMDEYLHDTFRLFYERNYFGMQKSFSGNSFHVYFGFDCDKTEENFNKAGEFAASAVRDVFKQIGWEEIINTENVLDNCTLTNSVQPVFLTDYYFYLNYKFDGSLYWKGEKNIFDDIKVENVKVPESSIKIIKGHYNKTPKIAKNIVSNIHDWRHYNRIKIIIILGKYFQDNKTDARNLYSKFIDKVVMRPDNDHGNHTKSYFMEKFDDQYNNLNKKNYSVNYSMLKFCEQNLGISFEYKVEKADKVITVNKADKLYKKKKVYMHSLELV